MVIAVSACLLGQNCKYNGGNNRNEKLLEYLKGHTVLPICPETLGGLPTPRVPSEISDGRVINKEGKDVTAEFVSGAHKALETVRSGGAEMIILQSRSPSCGAKNVYDGTFSGRTVEGKGIFAALAEEDGYRIIDVEDL